MKKRKAFPSAAFRAPVGKARDKRSLWFVCFCSSQVFEQTGFRSSHVWGSSVDGRTTVAASCIRSENAPVLDILLDPAVLRLQRLLCVKECVEITSAQPKEVPVVGLRQESMTNSCGVSRMPRSSPLVEEMHAWVNSANSENSSRSDHAANAGDTLHARARQLTSFVGVSTAAVFSPRSVYCVAADSVAGAGAAASSDCVHAHGPTMHDRNQVDSCGREGPTGRRSTKELLSCPAEDLPSHSHVETGVSPRPADRSLAQVVGADSPLKCQQPGTRFPLAGATSGRLEGGGVPDSHAVAPRLGKKIR